MNPYHKFLIKHRRYCERCAINTLTPATKVMRDKGHDVAVCDACYDAYHPIETGLRERARLERP